MLTEKEKYTLKYYADQNNQKVPITLDLDNELLEFMDKYCLENDISRDDFLTLSLTSMLIDIEKEKHINEFENIIDIFDFYKIEELIDTGKKYLVISPYGKNLVLLPVNEFEKIKNKIDELSFNEKRN